MSSLRKVQKPVYRNMVENLENTLSAIRGQRVAECRGEVEECHGCGKYPCPNDGGRAVPDSVYHEHRKSDQRGQESRAVADAVCNFLPEGLRPMPDCRCFDHNVSFVRGLTLIR